MTKLTTSTFDHAQPKTFDQLLISMNLYQHAKSHAISLICFRDIDDLQV